MKKVLIVDNRPAYYQSITSRIEISDELEMDAEVFLYTNNSEFQEFITRTHFDIIAVASGVVAADDFLMPNGQKIFGYLERKNTDNNIFTNNGITDLGYYNDSYGLLQKLESIDVSEIKEPDIKEIKQELPVEIKNDTPAINKEEIKETVNNSEPPKASFCSNCGAKLLPETKFCHICGTPVASTNSADVIRLAAEQRDNNTENVTELVNNDIAPHRHKCKIVSTYAAKGGVGKTTIAANLAVLLALTSTDRRRTRVCVVDFNIDFGDIRTTLNFSHKGKTMVDWLADIDLKSGNGIDPKDINYTKEEIENFLQKKVFKKSLKNNEVEIYGLIAPLVHKDSMGISEKSFEIMLRNLKENGDFDYIICDTGNNTRDSSFTALDMADKILLLATQDVTTVNCNDSFLKTMDEIADFDKSKVYLVINNIISAKETGVSVKDIEEAVRDFVCIARIRRYPGIILANNKGIPAVFDSGSQFTKELSGVVSILTEENLEIKPKKKGILSIFKK